MPVPWIYVPWPETEPAKAPVAEVVRTVAIQQRIDDDLLISAETSSYDPNTKVWIFSRGVVATYGLSTVKSDRLELRLAEGDRRAIATGNVQLEDPDVTLQAQNLDFSWDPAGRTGRAENATIRIGRLQLQAEQVNIKPELYEFINVSATTNPGNPALYLLRSPRLTLVPGKSGSAQRPSLFLFGQKLVTLPDRNFNLDPRTQGVSLPSISYRRGAGLGVSFQAGRLLDERTNLYVGAATFPGSYPGFGAVVTRSSVPVERSNQILTPASDLGERFYYGYFENIDVNAPANERAFLRSDRRAVSVSSVWNAGVGARGADTFVTKALEGVYEIGGTYGGRRATRENEYGEKEEVIEGGVGYYGQTRLQHIRERGGPFTARAVAIGSLQLPTYNFGPRLSTLGRIDTSIFGGRNQFGWIRGSAGLVYQALPQLRLAGAFVTSAEAGTPQFAFDPLYAKSGYHLRGDLNLGATRVSYLTKYDTRLKMYDREYMISQVAGAFEPFLVYRKFPQEYRFGLRLRIDEFYEILRRKTFRRRTPAKATASPTPSRQP